MLKWPYDLGQLYILLLCFFSYAVCGRSGVDLQCQSFLDKITAALFLGVHSDGMVK